MTLVNLGFKGLTLTQLSLITFVFNKFDFPIKSLLLGTKSVFKHQDLRMIKHGKQM